ncbi:MAG: hypothetical protein JWN85_2930 [Gammaproteobacteria bacterium]|nr:hypothetical protein [Gammaproteobacteria bacterium]
MAAFERRVRAAQLLFVLAALLLAQAARAQTLAVIVNPANSVHALSRREALDIFVGRYRTFPSGMAALPIDLGISSPERTQFYLVLAHKDLSDMTSYWARVTFSGRMTPPFQVADARLAVDLVATNLNAIAYVNSASVDKRVRVVLEFTP